MTAYTKFDNMDRIARLEKAVHKLIAITDDQEKVNARLHKKNKQLRKDCKERMDLIESMVEMNE